VSRTRPFGVSTHLFHGQRLAREHIREVGAAGFEVIELFATRTHFDYHNASTVADLRGWLAEAGVVLQSVHAPIGESFTGGRWGGPLNLASSDAGLRQRALDEALAALQIARQVPFAVLVVHAGVPRSQQQSAGENSRDAARRSIDALAAAAAPLGVRVAVEVIPNELSKAGSLVHFVEEVLEDEATGICLDFGHAHLDGDVVDAVETVSEHLIATHVHDNRGRADDHLLPFDGTIEWPSALTAMQKVGYDGPVMLEVAASGATKELLGRARTVRSRMERLLAHL
jgi:sugar phosphate isomerase/epimerase